MAWAHLAAFGIPDVPLDPVLDLRAGNGALILSNDNWKDTQRSLIEGTIFQPTDDRESVIVATLVPANYTAVLTGKNNTTGVGIVEVYDNNVNADSQLANISTRGFVRTGSNVMIGGFILGAGQNNARIAIRGIGPSLSQFGLNNVLADPDAGTARFTMARPWSRTITGQRSRLRRPPDREWSRTSNPKESGISPCWGQDSSPPSSPGRTAGSASGWSRFTIPVVPEQDRPASNFSGHTLHPSVKNERDTSPDVLTSLRSPSKLRWDCG